MKIEYTGKTVLVTGATRGIGAQIADDMEKCGACLILVGSNQDRIDQLNKEAGSKRRYYAADFTDRTSVEDLVAELSSHHEIDVCINNAGINRINPIDTIENKDWDDVLSVNLEAPFIITRAVSKGMKDRCYGRIVNIASIFGVISKEKRALYSMSKFGLRGLTVASALDLAPFNVLANTVSPGFVLTELTQSILSKEEMAQLGAQVPLGRFAKAEEISKAVLFLASDLNTYITGQNLIIDGGFVNV